MQLKDKLLRLPTISLIFVTSPAWRSIVRMPGRGSKTSGRSGIVAGRTLIIVSTLQMEMRRDWSLPVGARIRALSWATVERDHLCTRPRLLRIAEDYPARHTHTITPTDTR